MTLKFIMNQDTFNVISAYVPQMGLAKHLKVNLLKDLEGLL